MAAFCKMAAPSAISSCRHTLKKKQSKDKLFGQDIPGTSGTRTPGYPWPQPWGTQHRNFMHGISFASLANRATLCHQVEALKKNPWKTSGHLKEKTIVVVCRKSNGECPCICYEIHCVDLYFCGKSFSAVTSIGGHKDGQISKVPSFTVKMANKDRHIIVAVFVAFRVFTFSSSLYLSPSFSLFPAVSWHLGSPKQPTKWGYRQFFVFILAASGHWELLGRLGARRLEWKVCRASRENDGTVVENGINCSTLWLC